MLALLLERLDPRQKLPLLPVPRTLALDQLLLLLARESLRQNHIQALKQELPIQVVKAKDLLPIPEVLKLDPPLQLQVDQVELALLLPEHKAQLLLRDQLQLALNLLQHRDQLKLGHSQVALLELNLRPQGHRLQVQQQRVTLHQQGSQHLLLADLHHR